MRAKLSATFSREGDESQVTLGTFEYVPEGGRIPTMTIGEPEIVLPDGSKLTITSSWVPGNSMVSILVIKDGCTIGHCGASWHVGNPYLGVQIGELGFLHVVCGKE